MRRTYAKIALLAIAMWACLTTIGPPAYSEPLTFDDFISLGRVSDPRIAPDGKFVVFVVTRYDKEANKGNSDIYLVPIGGGETRRLTQSPKSDSQPRFSPDGKWIAFRSSRSGKSQIWLLPTAGGEARQLTKLSTGASGPQWTPDGRSIVFTSRVYPDCPDDDCNAERIKEQEDSKVQARVYDDLFYRHWDEWLDDRRSHILKVSVDDETVTDLVPGPYDYPTSTLGSGHDYAISPDGSEICFVTNMHPNRAVSINNDLFLLTIDGGDMKRLTDNAANDNHPVYSPDGKHIAYRAMSRAGFEADRYELMLLDRSTGESRSLSAELAGKLDRSVRSIAWFPNSRSILVSCSDAGYVSLYEVNIRDGKTKQLTRDITTSSPLIRPDGKGLVFLAQDSRTPYEVFTSNTSGGSIEQLSHINDAALSKIDMNPVERFSYAGAGDTPVHGFLLKPPGFDERNKYPLVFLVHGGPQGAWSDSFHWRWNYQMFAAAGYVVSMINPRGSTGYGQTFTDEISRDWGGKVYEDLMKGVDYLLATYAFIDTNRVAAAGGSYGGYMMNWIAGHTDRFRCLVNHDGLYNFTSFYGTTEELWFPEWDLGKSPWDDPESYAQYSPHTYAGNFKTPMLVIHGGKDYRVDPSESFQVFTTLKRRGLPAKFLYFPDEGHWVLKPLNAELWWSTVHEWLAKWLK